MAEHPDPFSVNVGSKLLFGAIMLMGLGLVGAILGPLLTPGGVFAVVPGLALIGGGIVLGILAGIFLGYANGKYPPPRR